MTRHRPSARGTRPTRPAALILLAVTAIALAACGSPADGSDPGGRSLEPVATGPDSSGAPTSDAPSASGPVSPKPVPSEPATPEPVTPEPVTQAPESGLPDGPAAACTGNDDNRDFYAELAEDVGWQVYCPVLPQGWFVGSGQYSGATGGRLEITYRGPGGAGLMVQEGAFCASDDGCVPAGEELGTTDFADTSGSLIATDGGYAIVVNRGAQPSWLLTISGVGEAAARQIGAGMAPVGS